MRGSLRTLFFLTAACTAAVILYAGLTTPPSAVTLGPPPASGYAAGGYHIHTVRSDGSGTVDDVAAAAARAGLTFVVFTDHGDGTRAPDPPTYRHGVLCIDAVELNTHAGHVVALGLVSAAPYPLAGSARDVIEDVHRLGGRTVVAHPDSPKPDLRWQATGTQFDGIEWLNVDAEWRDESPSRLFGITLRALFRAPESILLMFERPARTLERWDAAARLRPVFGLAALDAHARIGWHETEEPRGRAAVHRPSYETMFQILNQTVLLERPLTGDADDDARTIMDALIDGRSFSVISALAHPAELEFTIAQGDLRARMGDRVRRSSDDLVVRAAIPRVPDARVVLLRDGKSVAMGEGALDRTLPSTAGVYRIEAFLSRSTVPWIVSNPIVIESEDGASTSSPSSGRGDGRPSATEGPRIPFIGAKWGIERDDSSTGSVNSVRPGSLDFSFALGRGSAGGQYVAAVADPGVNVSVNGIRFTATASSPMRVSVQLRLPVGGEAGRRWRRSVYLDAIPRTIALRLQDFEPVGSAAMLRPVPVPIQSLMIVVDTLNTVPGSAGRVSFSDISLGVAE